MESITCKIVSCFREFDLEQTEGGIYALPDRYSKGNCPASHHHIYGGEHPELDLCSRIGVKRQEARNKRIGFEIGGEPAIMQFIDIALTKVRSYGDRYQLDKHHGKKWEDCSQELKKAVSRLNKEVKRGYSGSAFLVAFVFTDSQKHGSALVAPSIAEDFLNRHGLTSSYESWRDPHGRGIWTTVVCWRAQNNEV